MITEGLTTKRPIRRDQPGRTQFGNGNFCMRGALCSAVKSCTAVLVAAIKSAMSAMVFGRKLLWLSASASRSHSLGAIDRTGLGHGMRRRT